MTHYLVSFLFHIHKNYCYIPAEFRVLSSKTENALVGIYITSLSMYFYSFQN